METQSYHRNIWHTYRSKLDVQERDCFRSLTDSTITPTELYEKYCLLLQMFMEGFFWLYILTDYSNGSTLSDQVVWTRKKCLEPYLCHLSSHKAFDLLAQFTNQSYTTLMIINEYHSDVADEHLFYVARHRLLALEAQVEEIETSKTALESDLALRYTLGHRSANWAVYEDWTNRAWDLAVKFRNQYPTLGKSYHNLGWLFRHRNPLYNTCLWVASMCAEKPYVPGRRAILQRLQPKSHAFLELYRKLLMEQSIFDSEIAGFVSYLEKAILEEQVDDLVSMAIINCCTVFIYGGDVDASFHHEHQAISLFNKMFELILEIAPIGALPATYVILVFLQYVISKEEDMMKAIIESFPFQQLVSVLSNLREEFNMMDCIPKLIVEGQLPFQEDHLLRGQFWTEQYYSGCWQWGNTSSLYDRRNRMLRVLALGQHVVRSLTELHLVGGLSSDHNGRTIHL